MALAVDLEVTSRDHRLQQAVQRALGNLQTPHEHSQREWDRALGNELQRLQPTCQRLVKLLTVTRASSQGRGSNRAHQPRVPLMPTVAPARAGFGDIARRNASPKAR